MRIAAWFVLAFCAACASAPPPAETPPPQNKTRSIAGVVHFEGAPRPPKFSVSLSDRTQSFTAPDGSFRLENIADRLATLHFEAPGFASTNLYLAIPEAGEARAEVTLHPSCAIRGVVRDGKKDAVGGAIVTLAHAAKSFYWSQRPNVQSNADGTFELGDVPPGPAYLNVSATGLARAFAGPIEVVHGKPVAVEVALSKPISIRGRVVSRGVPVTDATVELRADRPDAYQLGLIFTNAETDERGHFAIDDSGPGPRRLVVTVVRGEERERGVQRAIQVEIPAKELEIDLAEGDLTLEISFPSGERGELLLVPGKIFAERALDLESLLGTVHYAQVGEHEKSAKFEHVASGDHTLILMPPPDLRLLPGGCHCIQQQIHLEAGAKTAQIEMKGKR